MDVLLPPLFPCHHSFFFPIALPHAFAFISTDDPDLVSSVRLSHYNPPSLEADWSAVSCNIAV